MCNRPQPITYDDLRKKLLIHAKVIHTGWYSIQSLIDPEEVVDKGIEKGTAKGCFLPNGDLHPDYNMSYFKVIITNLYRDAGRKSKKAAEAAEEIQHTASSPEPPPIRRLDSDEGRNALVEWIKEAREHINSISEPKPDTDTGVDYFVVFLFLARYQWIVPFRELLSSCSWEDLRAASENILLWTKEEQDRVFKSKAHWKSINLNWLSLPEDASTDINGLCSYFTTHQNATCSRELWFQWKKRAKNRYRLRMEEKHPGAWAKTWSHLFTDKPRINKAQNTDTKLEA